MIFRDRVFAVILDDALQMQLDLTRSSNVKNQYLSLDFSIKSFTNVETNRMIQFVKPVQ